MRPGTPDASSAWSTWLWLCCQQHCVGYLAVTRLGSLSFVAPSFPLSIQQPNPCTYEHPPHRTFVDWYQSQALYWPICWLSARLIPSTAQKQRCVHGWSFFWMCMEVSMLIGRHRPRITPAQIIFSPCRTSERDNLSFFSAKIYVLAKMSGTKHWGGINQKKSVKTEDREDKKIFKPWET